MIDQAKSVYCKANSFTLIISLTLTPSHPSHLRAHEASRPRVHACFPSGGVRVCKILRGYFRIKPKPRHAIGLFERVSQEMLTHGYRFDVRADVIALHPRHICRGHFGGERGVFSKGFAAAAPARVCGTFQELGNF